MPIPAIIVLTNSSEKIGGDFRPDIPSIVWDTGIDEASSDWFREQVLKQGVAPSSVKEYAKVLRPFLLHCRRCGKVWQDVDDEFLSAYRDRLRSRLKLRTVRVNKCLYTIFKFYCWAEESGRLKYRVGIYAKAEVPIELRDLRFAISAKRNPSNPRRKTLGGAWTTPLLLKDSGKGSTFRHTPNEEEVRSLHRHAMEQRHGVRNTLMMAWAEETGLRRAEVLRVKKSHLPSDDELAQVIENDTPIVIHLTRKGGATKRVAVLPDLLLRTADFVENERAAIVKQCRDKPIVGYVEPDDIFLSESTGEVLHPDSVTHIGSQLFRLAGIKNASFHRLRAKFAIEVIESLVDSIFDGTDIGPESSWIETILVKAAEIMGHASPASLRPYLTYVLNRRIKNADASSARILKARLRQLSMEESVLVKRLEEHQELQTAAMHIKAGRKSEAAAALVALAGRLSKRS